jgi:hypothetical protein
MPQAEVMFTRGDRALPAFCLAGTPEKEMRDEACASGFGCSPDSPLNSSGAMATREGWKDATASNPAYR